MQCCYTWDNIHYYRIMHLLPRKCYTKPTTHKILKYTCIFMFYRGTTNIKLSHTYFYMHLSPSNKGSARNCVLNKAEWPQILTSALIHSFLLLRWPFISEILDWHSLQECRSLFKSICIQRNKMAVITYKNSMDY